MKQPAFKSEATSKATATVIAKKAPSAKLGAAKGGVNPVAGAVAMGTELAQIRVRAKLDARLWRATAEVFWADPLPKRDGFAKLDSIPVYATGLAFGDLVMTDHSDDHFIQEVVERSGHSTFRIKFLDAWPEEEVLSDFWARYEALGCTFAAMKSALLMAICSPPGIDSRKVSDMLNKDQANYDFEYEATYMHPYR